MEEESSSLIKKLTLEEKSSINGNNLGYMFLPERSTRTKSRSRRKQEMAENLRQQRQQEKSDQGIVEISYEDEEESGEVWKFSYEELMAWKQRKLVRLSEKTRSNKKKIDSDEEEEVSDEEMGLPSDEEEDLTLENRMTA